MQVTMFENLNDDQSKLAAKTMADAAKLIYLGSAAAPLFGEIVPQPVAIIGFILATLLAWASMDVLR